MPVNLYGAGDNFNPQTSHVIPALIKSVLMQPRISLMKLRYGAMELQLVSFSTPVMLLKQLCWR